jgi:DNA-binding response OmpR family regulator
MAKILVVEANEKNSARLRELIGNWGQEAICIDNGKDAVKLAEEQQPDLVITAVFLPGLNGYEICQAIRKNSMTADIPVILFSDLLGKEEKIHGYNVGADMCLTKPVEDEVLEAIVEGMLVRKKREGRKESWRSLVYFLSKLMINSKLIEEIPVELLKKEEVYCSHLARSYDLPDKDIRHMRIALYLQDWLTMLNKLSPTGKLDENFANLRISQWLVPLIDNKNLPKEQRTPATNIFSVVTAYGKLYMKKKNNADAALTALRREALASGEYDLAVLKSLDKLVREQQIVQEL